MCCSSFASFFRRVVLLKVFALCELAVDQQCSDLYDSASVSKTRDRHVIVVFLEYVLIVVKLGRGGEERIARQQLLQGLDFQLTG